MGTESDILGYHCCGDRFTTKIKGKGVKGGQEEKFEDKEKRIEE